MTTTTLSGPSKYDAIARLGIAESIGQQDANAIVFYSSHEESQSFLIQAQRLPYHIDVYVMRGAKEEREKEVAKLLIDLQTAYANLKAASNGN